METLQIVVREIPADLWFKFKAKTALERSTIQAELAKAISQYLKSA